MRKIIVDIQTLDATATDATRIKITPILTALDGKVLFGKSKTYIFGNLDKDGDENKYINLPTKENETVGYKFEFERDNGKWDVRALWVDEGTEVLLSELLISGGTATDSVKTYVAKEIAKTATAINLSKIAGYTGDGAANDAAAMQTALNTLFTNGGGEVFFQSDKTTLLDSNSTKNFGVGNKNSNLIFRGDGLSLVKVSANQAIHIENGDTVLIEDLSFPGSTSNNESDGVADFSQQGVFLSSAALQILNRLKFFGLATSGTGDYDGLVTFTNGNVKITDCYAGGCSARTALFNIINPFSVNCDGNRIIDFAVHNGISYNKYGKLEVEGAWIKARTNLDSNNSLISPQWTFKNNHYDEGCRAALDLDVSASPTADRYILHCENETMSSGHPALADGEQGKYLKAKGFGIVRLKDIVIGYSDILNKPDHEALILEDCKVVYIDGLTLHHNAKWITIKGAVEKVYVRDYKFPANATHADGFNNLAGAEIVYVNEQSGGGGGEAKKSIKMVISQLGTADPTYFVIGENTLGFDPVIYRVGVGGYRITGTDFPRDKTFFRTAIGFSAMQKITSVCVGRFDPFQYPYLLQIQTLSGLSTIAELDCIDGIYLEIEIEP